MQYKRPLLFLFLLFAVVIIIPNNAYSMAISEGHLIATTEWNNPLLSDFTLDLNWNAVAFGYGESDWDPVSDGRSGRFTAAEDGSMEINMDANFNYYLMIQDAEEMQHSIFSLDTIFIIHNETTDTRLLDYFYFGVDGDGIFGATFEEMSGSEGADLTVSIDYQEGDILAWSHQVHASGSVLNWASASVPEPSSLLLLGLCLIVFAALDSVKNKHFPRIAT